MNASHPKSKPDSVGSPLASLLSALDREGYVVVPAALDERWVDRLRRAFDSAPVQPSGTQHVDISDETPEIDAWRALEQHPTLLAAAAHVLAGAPRVVGSHGRNPLPGFGQQGLHADDVPRASGDPFTVFTVLWMLDDFTAANGGTRVVPGSHLITRQLPKALAQPLARHPDERVIVGRAGDALMLNGHTLHSGRRNDSQGPRRSVQMVIRRAPA